MSHLDAQVSQAGGLVLLAILLLLIVAGTRKLCNLPDEHLLQRRGGWALSRLPRVLQEKGRTVADIVTNRLGVVATILALRLLWG